MKSFLLFNILNVPVKQDKRNLGFFVIQCYMNKFFLFSIYVQFLVYLFSNKPISRFVRHRGTQAKSGILSRDVLLCLFL